MSSSIKLMLETLQQVSCVHFMVILCTNTVNVHFGACAYASTEGRVCDPRWWKQPITATPLSVPKTIPGGSTLAVCTQFPPKLHDVTFSTHSNPLRVVLCWRCTLFQNICFTFFVSISKFSFPELGKLTNSISYDGVTSESRLQKKNQKTQKKVRTLAKKEVCQKRSCTLKRTFKVLYMCRITIWIFNNYLTFRRDP